MDHEYQTVMLLRIICILILVVSWLGVYRCAQCALKSGVVATIQSAIY
jgi:hypothetical protein